MQQKLKHTAIESNCQNGKIINTLEFEKSEEIFSNKNNFYFTLDYIELWHITKNACTQLQVH